MAAAEQQAARPWYRQSWAAWPTPVRVFALAVLVSVFAGICWAGAMVPASPAVASAMKDVNHWRANAGTVWNAVQVVSGAGLLLLKQLGPWVIGGALALLVLGNAVCMGLGTLCVRLAFAQAEVNGFQRIERAL